MKNGRKKLISIFLVFAMLITMLPSFGFTTDVKAAESKTIVVHYSNADTKWGSVYGYAWDQDTESILNSSWPGTIISKNGDNANWYDLVLTGITSTDVGVIFNNGSVGYGNQTGNIVLENVKDGAEYWCYYDGSTTSKSTTKPSGWTVEKTVTECSVKLHFANTTGWDAVCGFAWKEKGENDESITGNWPGIALTKDADGYYTFEFSYKPVVGQSVGYVFSNNSGNQTVDLYIDYATLSKNSSVELWVQPLTKNEEGKNPCSVVAAEKNLIISPEVNGNQVTFRYKNDYATKVQVYGTMNSWKSGYTMTKGSDGIYTTTLTLDPGVYQYKLVVDYSGSTGNWIADPNNPVTIGKDANSAFVVSDESAIDDDTVTVKLHYSRFDENYSGWNVWMWTLNQGGAQYDFTVSNGEAIATIEVPGRTTRYVSYIVRKGNWETQEYGERIVDLSTVVSGTVHYYITSGVEAGTKLSGADAITGNKIIAAEFDYDTDKIQIQTSLPISEDPLSVFSIIDITNKDTGIKISDITANGCIYTLTLNKALDLVNLYKYKIRYEENNYPIRITTVYASDKFAEDFTYDGEDLGATWTPSTTTFKVWAPSAEKLQLNLYTTGSDSEEGAYSLGTYAMVKGENGVWSVAIQGDLRNIYYTYYVKNNGEFVEICDPYAKATGVNGKRAMVVNLDSTDPEGWCEDVSPNKGMKYTDAIIYELHIRDFSIDDSSGVSDEYQGKFLGLTEEGTTTPDGTITGLDYLKNLGITHLHLLPIYDYASVDETRLDEAQFNWGYDPLNYNVPEGSYSTNPYDGNVRIKEMKEMVQTLHENGINVIMDVVYNHVYDAGSFSFNQMVPGYFSRTNADGSYSNGSGCGNDTASEREMVQKYIVESVMYWAEEYHIDGFRFDLVGLLDAETINLIVDTVHKKYPEVIFYGEGWTLGTAAEEGTIMATQANSSHTPKFAYFSDTIRNLLAGDNGKSTGFVSGLTGQEEPLAYRFKANSWWTTSPTQTVNYVSCHDNLTLMDKLQKTRSDASRTDLIKMNNLAAAIYMTAQGIPFIHAGEEFLRQKTDEKGNMIENSYNANDYVNSLKWDNLDNSRYADVSDYYKGLIEFRKNHAALRLTTASEINANVRYHWISNEVVLFDINGKSSISDEVSDGIVVIFNATTSSKTIHLTSAGVDSGTWKVCIDGDRAGTDTLYTVTNGTVTVDPISALVLVKGETVDTDSVYDQNTSGNEVIEPLSAALQVNGSTAAITKPVGSTITLDVAATGGSGDYTYKFAVLNVKTGSWFVLKDFSDNVSYTTKLSIAGVKQFAVTVKDSTGTTVATNRITVTAEDTSLSGALQVNGSTAEITKTVGSSITLDVTAKGGSGSYTYKFAVFNEETGNWFVLRDFSANTSYTTLLKVAGAKQFAVTIKDSTGATVATNRIRVTAVDASEMLTGTLQVNGSTEALSKSVGSSITLDVTATGGSGSYTYKFAVLDVATGNWTVLQNFDSNSSYTFTLNYTGEKQFAVTVKDSTGATVATNRFYVTVEK